MKWISGFCLTCIFLCGTYSERVHAQTEQFIGFADSLFESAEYFEASIAWERVYYEAADPVVRIMANLNKAQALKQMGAYGKARRDLQRSLTYPRQDSLRKELFYELAFCAFMDSDPEDARDWLLQFRHHFGESSWQRVFLLEGLIFIELEEYDALEAHLEEWILNFSEDQELAGEKIQRYSTILEAKNQQPPRDPERARLLSTFIPGSGQVYAGETGWGGLNAFSQLASLGAFTAMAMNGYYIAAVFAGLGPFQSFYFGGIRQAGLFAEAHEKSRRANTRAALRELLFDVEEMLSAD